MHGGKSIIFHWKQLEIIWVSSYKLSSQNSFAHFFLDETHTQQQKPPQNANEAM